MRVSVDKTRSNRVPARIDNLRFAPGKRANLGIAPNRSKSATLDCERLDFRHAWIDGVDIAVNDDQIGCSDGAGGPDGEHPINERRKLCCMVFSRDPQ